LIIAILFSGCSTFVTFNTQPQGAKIYINENPVGKTPFTYSLSDFVFDNYNIKITKEGYKEIICPLEKELKPGPFILGLFLAWPFLLWCYGPKTNYYFELTPAGKDSL